MKESHTQGVGQGSSVFLFPNPEEAANRTASLRASASARKAEWQVVESSGKPSEKD